MKNRKRFFNLLHGGVKVEQPKNIVNDARSEATIYVYDEISWWGINAEWFVGQLNALMDVPTINVRVNSPGGEIFEAIAMQTAMAQHPANIVVHVDGIAASAASFFIRGANKRVISDGGFLMIHQAMSGGFGNAKDLLSVGNALTKIDESIIDSYVKVTGLDHDVVKEWVEAETWLSASEAKEHGFVDDIFEAEPVENKFDLSSVFNHVPESIKNVVVEEPEQEEDPETENKYDSSKDELELLSLMASN
jgi:ATP-dependent protease ClpP protease subunit